MSYRKLAVPALLLLLAGCQKPDKPSEEQGAPAKFHKDIIVHENIQGSEQPQDALGLFPLADPSQLVMVAARGMYEADARGFRITDIKDNAVNWMKSYALPEAYSYQLATCAALDKAGNVWVGGHIFGVPDSYGRPFLVKLTAGGEILWSKYLYTYPPGPDLCSSRAIALKVLQNGDLAFLTQSSLGYTLYRLAVDGTVVWAKSIRHEAQSGSPLLFDLSFTLQNNLSPTNRVLAEASDGSLFIAFSSNTPVPGKDGLIKLSGSGQLLFAKSISAGSYPVYPPQIVCTENDQVVYADQRFAFISGRPHLYIFSKEGALVQAKGFPADRGVSNPFALNELNYFNGEVHLTTTAGYQFADYVLDLSLNVRSSGKVLGTNSISTDRGGVSVWDKATGTLLHVLDVAGGPGDGNGFQFLKTDATGKSCHGYTVAPEELVLEPLSATVKDEPSITLHDAMVPELRNLGWQPVVVAVQVQETVCSGK